MKFIFFLILFLLSVSLIFSQNNDILPDWDFDTLFDEPETKPEEEEVIVQHQASPVLSQIRRTGLFIHANYEMNFFVAPGWREYPWSAAEDKSYFFDRGILLKNTLTFDARISESFRVVHIMSLILPPVYRLTLDEFFFDYNLNNKVFIRGGRYEISWGISPNFKFTNLLARIPASPSFLGPSYTVKADYPIGFGGLQFLMMTRGNVQFLEREEIGLGAKYNFAIPFADFDFGMYYLDGMPFRSFLSIKKTIWKIEFYTEGLIAIDLEDNNHISGAVNLGFERAFFNDKLNINGEFFFNGEKGTYKYEAETDFKEADTVSFIEEFTMAFNLSLRLYERIDLRFVTGILYAPMQNSAHITPGFTLKPVKHFEINIAAPIAIGAEDGYYRVNTPRWAPGNEPLPFAIYILAKLSGGASL